MIDEIPYVNSVFEQPWWLNMVAPGCWKEAIVEDNGHIVGRLPYVLKRGNVQMPKLTQTLGPWIDSKYRCYQSGNNQLAKQKEIMYELLDQLPKHNSIQMTLDSSNSYILPFRWRGFSISPSFSYRIEDITNLNAVFDNFTKHKKRDLKISEKNGIKICESTDYQMMVLLINQTFEFQGRKNPNSSSFLIELMENAVRRESGKLLLAFDLQGNCHSGVFLVFDQNVCYYLLGGTATGFRNSYSQDLALWKSIEFAQTTSKSFDFEGSMVEGIENYFRSFGGRQVINYQVSKASLMFDIIDVMKPRIKKLIGYKI